MPLQGNFLIHGPLITKRGSGPELCLHEDVGELWQLADSDALHLSVLPRFTISFSNTHN